MPPGSGATNPGAAPVWTGGSVFSEERIGGLQGENSSGGAQVGLRGWHLGGGRISASSTAPGARAQLLPGRVGLGRQEGLIIISFL